MFPLSVPFFIDDFLSHGEIATLPRRVRDSHNETFCIQSSQSAGVSRAYALAKHPAPSPLDTEAEESARQEGTAALFLGLVGLFQANLTLAIYTSLCQSLHALCAKILAFGHLSFSPPLALSLLLSLSPTSIAQPSIASHALVCLAESDGSGCVSVMCCSWI